MTEINPPGFLQNRADHPASELRGYIAPLISSAGIIGAGDWQVSQRGAGANMSVDIAGGQGYILGTEDITQHYYHCYSDATVVNKTVAAAHATLNRTDIVIARVYDNQYSGATNIWEFEVITGTPGAGTPAAPATPNNSLVIATLYIAAAVTSVLTANITDTRVLVAVPVSSETHAAGTKSTPVDADEFPLIDSAASFGLKKITWANIKLALKKIGFGRTYTAETATYTFAAGDEENIFSMNNAVAQQFLIPTDATYPFANNVQFDVFWVTGAGQPSIAAATPGTTTVLSVGATSATPKLRVVNSGATVRKLAPDLWIVFGDVA